METAKERISTLLDDLSPEHLKSVEDFVRLLRQEGQSGSGPRYPTVENPASSLHAWLDLAPDGYDGDALTDTEALYDEVS
jgi:hypothetical protein